MDGEDYPAIKAACEGRQLPAYEAASEFISQVAGNLDELLEKASGKKGALNTLERLEQKRDRSMEELQKLMKQIAQAGPEQLPELEKQAVKAANQAQSQVNQTEAVGHMVRDQMLQNKEAVSGCFCTGGTGGGTESRKRFVGASGLGLRPLTAMIRSGERRTWSWPPASARVPRSWRWPAIWGA